MSRVVVVGSGPSGVHFALSALQKGYRVMMLDVGYEKPSPVNPEDSFNALKKNLADPVSYFLGEHFEGILLPDHEKEYYGIPVSKKYVFRVPSGFEYQAEGFSPLFSFAVGGLAEVWTGGCYPFNDKDLAEFPFGYAEIGKYYGEVARRIGISAAKDDLAKFYPWHDYLLEPLELDVHSKLLLEQYEKVKRYLNDRLKCYVGRTRVATLSRDQGTRKKCTYLGRCLWGCPSHSLYTPSITLAECREFPNFTYVSGMRVSHFTFNSGNRITSVVAEPARGGQLQEFPVDKIVLAAGALSSSQIFLESIYRNTGQIIELRGLMDNRQILVPFVNLRLIGHPYDPNRYQYHQLGMGIEIGEHRTYVHGQITTLKTSLLHPIMQNLPCDLRTAIFLLRHMHCALGIVNVNLPDRRRESNYVTLVKGAESGSARLAIHYAPAASERPFLRKAVRTVKQALLRLRCVVPPGMTHVRPMGASAHYAGTLPVSKEKRPYTTSENCQSHDFENLFIVDGATFPSLPSKNITFTLMANAIRVVEHAF